MQSKREGGGERESEIQAFLPQRWCCGYHPNEFPASDRSFLLGLPRIPSSAFKERQFFEYWPEFVRLGQRFKGRAV